MFPLFQHSGDNFTPDSVEWEMNAADMVGSALRRLSFTRKSLFHYSALSLAICNPTLPHLVAAAHTMVGHGHVIITFNRWSIMTAATKPQLLVRRENLMERCWQLQLLCKPHGFNNLKLPQGISLDVEPDGSPSQVIKSAVPGSFWISGRFKWIPKMRQISHA